MTQDNKDILLKDLCARLPYDVFVNISDIKCVLQPHDISDLIKCDVDIKPYLFPLSSMTEQQRKEFVNTLDKESNYGWTINTFDWCNKNHFDYRNLIPMNIAIDATNLDIY